MAASRPSPLTQVVMHHSAYCSAMTHAGTTSEYEVVGLMIGKVVEKPSGAVAHVHSCLSLPRPGRWPDRVEILPQPLAEASGFAERLSTVLGEDVRVLGWYHSHPRITVNPSHIDLKTQWNFQAMDPHFSGVIFAMFSGRGPVPSPSVKVRAFQSARVSETEHAEVNIKLSVAPMEDAPNCTSRSGLLPPKPLSRHCMESLVRIAQTLRHEEMALANYTRLDGSSDADNRRAATVDEFGAVQNDLCYAAATREIVQNVLNPLLMLLESRQSACMLFLNDLE